MASKKRAQEVCEEGYWDCNAWGDCWYVEEDCYFEEKDEAVAIFFLEILCIDFTDFSDALY